MEPDQAWLSHELRTPLTVALGRLQLLKRRWSQLPDDERLSALAEVEAGLRALTDAIGNVEATVAAPASDRAIVFATEEEQPTAIAL